MSSIAFARFWHVDLTRECFLSFLNQDDLQTMRLVSHDFASTIAPLLFKEVKLNFNATCFSRHARIAALSRIGHHIKTFTFNMPHNDDTFLPPLLDPETLDEVAFNYEPQLCHARPSSSSSTHNASPTKYGSWEMNDMLVRQYPLLFHAATNIPSFIQAIQAMPALRHLRISCPDNNPYPTHRRDIVDYALMSLRIAVEQSNPANLTTLSLDPIRPSATFYLRPQTTIGSSPSSTRVWRKIKSLNILMENPDCDYTKSETSADDLKSLHTYLTVFCSLKDFNFTWLGHKGPNPLSLDTEPCTSNPSSLDYSTCAPSPSTPPSLSSSPSSARSSASSFSLTSTSRRPRTALRSLRFRHLKSMRLYNASFDAIQASDVIHSHRKTLADFKFESCHLRTGTWDDALEPLTHISGSDDWRRKQHDNAAAPASEKADRNTHPALRRRPKLQIPVKQSRREMGYNEIMDVPLMLSPDEEIPDMELVKDRMWKPDTISVFDDLDDICSLSNSTPPRSKRKRSVKALRRLGEKLGFPMTRIEEADIAMEGVRRLLKGGRMEY